MAKSWGFLKSLSHGSKAVEKFYSPQEKAALAETAGQSGGYLVPTDFSTALLEARSEYGLFRQKALVLPMTTGQMTAPMPSIKQAASAGVSPFFGGISFSWQVETPGLAVPDSLPNNSNVFQEVSLKPWDLIGQVAVTNQFLADMGPAGETALLALFGRAAAWYEDYAFFNGTGAGISQPLGILKAPGSKSVTRAIASHISQADVGAMSKGIYPLGWGNAIWACSPSALEDIFKITGFQANQPQTAEGVYPAGSLMARPLYVTEKLPALGTAGDLVFFDPSAYIIGDRQDVLIESSIHPLFTTQKTVFRVWLRVDGKPLFSDLITLADASSTTSSQVILT